MPKTFTIVFVHILPENHMGQVTIKDVAKVAGVSYATVSRALSGSSEIGNATREKILKLCEEMGYTPNSIARSMIIKRTYTIGLIIGTMNNPFMSEMSNFVEQKARESGYNLMVCTSSYDANNERKAFELLVGRQVDGIVFLPATRDSYENIKPLISKIPTVFLSENLQDKNVNYVAVDNFKGTKIGTQYLYDLGHRKTLYLGRRHNSYTHKLRASGYEEACIELGIEPDFLYTSSVRSSMEVGYELASEYFKQGIRHTALFCATDSMAIGAMRAADEMNIRIPDDISMMGFDNIIFSGLPRINLTTVEQPMKKMADTAVNMLLQEIDDPEGGGQYAHVILEPSLVKRSSCKEVN